MTGISLDRWRRAFGDEPDSARDRVLREIYGDSELAERQRARFSALLERFARMYGPADSVVIARAPGRVNLVGMHTDHQGSAVNPIAIKETRVIASPRADDQVRLANVDGRFPPRTFRIADLLPDRPVDWSRWTHEVVAQRQAAGRSVDWSDYIKAAVVRMQERERRPDGGYRRALCGMNLLVEGDLPVAAGLSSSSALVVAAAYAVIGCNGLDAEPAALIELLGESEWYVGLRGGVGDHAVILLARAGHLSHIELLPTRVEYAPFPPTYRVVVCHSGVEADKSGGARNTYNERVAGYALGLLLLRQKYGPLLDPVERFRDLHPTRLGISTAAFYEMLKSLPIRACRRDLAQWLPDRANALASIYRTHHEEPGGYRLRGVCLYGVAECERARMALPFLRDGNVEGFGELMNLSHDGDRVSRHGAPIEPDIGDAYFDRLIQLAESPDPSERAKAALYRQPGAYAASCVELDTLVDVARGVEGVLGAGLVGAGLGGCVSILVRRETVDELVETLQRAYFSGRGNRAFLEVCVPVAGAGVLHCP